MITRPRTARVLASLVASMTIGAILLLALDSRPLPAGAFSLASYSRLNAVGDIIAPRAGLVAGRWNCIEIFYSRTAGASLEQLASLSGLKDVRELNCHFVVANGKGSADGQIDTTYRWQQQWACVPSGSWYGTGSTIRICVVADGQNRPTDYQVKRTAALIDELARKLHIPSVAIRYPANWQL